MTRRRLQLIGPLVVALACLAGCSSSVGTASSTTATSSTSSSTGGTSGAAASAVLKVGSTGPAVLKLQQRLTALGYRPGSVDGHFGAATSSAVLAFQKRQGLARDGVAGTAVLAALDDPTGAGPRSGGPTPRIEVDIARQIAFVILPGQPVVTLNVSTGSGKTYRKPGGGTDVADTPTGTFAIVSKVAANQKAPLGTLYYPMYFYKGWALHGSPSIPGYPASHGCVRMSNVDDDWLFPKVLVGTPVIIYDTTGKSPAVTKLPGDAAGGS